MVVHAVRTAEYIASLVKKKIEREGEKMKKPKKKEKKTRKKRKK